MVEKKNIYCWEHYDSATWFNIFEPLLVRFILDDRADKITRETL